MVAIVLVHMVQVFLFGAYKFPRELTWLVGVCLLLMTLGMAFSGQVMRFDQDAYWGLGIGASIVSRVPLVGPALVSVLLGGPTIAGATLSRFFAVHVFVIPALNGLIGLHLLLVLKLGINEWPMPGRVVQATYLKGTASSRRRDGEPFVPDAIWKDIFFSDYSPFDRTCAVFGPFGPGGQPDPTIIRRLSLTSSFCGSTPCFRFSRPKQRRRSRVIGPIVALVVLLGRSVSPARRRAGKRRPVAVLTVLLSRPGRFHPAGSSYSVEWR